MSMDRKTKEELLSLFEAFLDRFSLALESTGQVWQLHEDAREAAEEVINACRQALGDYRPVVEVESPISILRDAFGSVFGITAPITAPSYLRIHREDGQYPAMVVETLRQRLQEGVEAGERALRILSNLETACKEVRRMVEEMTSIISPHATAAILANE